MDAVGFSFRGKYSTFRHCLTIGDILEDRVGLGYVLFPVFLEEGSISYLKKNYICKSCTWNCALFHQVDFSQIDTKINHCNKNVSKFLPIETLPFAETGQYFLHIDDQLLV